MDRRLPGVFTTLNLFDLVLYDFRRRYCTRCAMISLLLSEGDDALPLDQSGRQQIALSNRKTDDESQREYKTERKEEFGDLIRKRRDRIGEMVMTELANLGFFFPFCCISDGGSSIALKQFSNLRKALLFLFTLLFPFFFFTDDDDFYSSFGCLILLLSFPMHWSHT